MWGDERSRTVGDADVGRWAYRPRALATYRADEALAFRARLASAVRAGHGLDVAFGIRLEGSSEPALYLKTRGSDARRWADRVFVRAYGEDRWQRAAPAPSAVPPTAWWGRRIRPWPATLHSPAEAASLMDLFTLTFTSVRPATVLEAGFAPVPVPRSSWWESTPPTTGVLPAGHRPPPPGRGTVGVSPAFAAPAPIARPLFWTARVALFEEPANGRPTAHLPEVARALERASRGAAGGGLRFRGPLRLAPWGPTRFVVSEEELLALLPGPDASGAGARAGDVRSVTTLPVGRTASGRVVGPPIERDQGRHLVVLGETGMGKSSLLVALSRRVSERNGLLLLDPLGETARAFEEELDVAALGRTIRISPERSRVGVNALEGVGLDPEEDPVRAERRLNDLVFALRRVRAGRYTDSGFWGPRLEEMLYRALRAAAAWPNGTLVDAHTLLATGARLHREVPPRASPVLRELADRVRERPEDGEGARRLLNEVVRSPVLERMLCARDPDLATRDLVVPNRIVIVSGDAARIGESNARYLLSVYLALLWSELLARPPGPKTFVVLDEAQWFSHESLAEMLRLGRRANVHVVLATQALASLPPAVAQAVWTNVADFVAFRGSPEEARELGRMSRAVSPEAVVALPRGHAVVLLGKGESVAWVRTTRLPPRGPSPAPGAAPRRDPTPDEPSRPKSASEETDPRGPADPPPGGPPARPTPPGFEEVLRAIENFANAAGDGPTVRVPLDALRAALDPSGRAVRAAGTRLGRAGAIVATDRTPNGPEWVLRRDRLPTAGERAPRDGRPGTSDSTQPS